MIYFIYFSVSLTSYSPRFLGRERSPDNHTQFHTKMFKIYVKNHTLWGGTYLYTLYRGFPLRVETVESFCVNHCLQLFLVYDCLVVWSYSK